MFYLFFLNVFDGFCCSGDRFRFFVDFDVGDCFSFFVWVVGNIGASGGSSRFLFNFDGGVSNSDGDDSGSGGSGDSCSGVSNSDGDDSGSGGSCSGVSNSDGDDSGSGGIIPRLFGDGGCDSCSGGDSTRRFCDLCDAESTKESLRSFFVGFFVGFTIPVSSCKFIGHSWLSEFDIFTLFNCFACMASHSLRCFSEMFSLRFFLAIMYDIITL